VLNEKQLLLLDNLIYLDDITRRDGTTVGEIVQHALDSGKFSGAALSADEWKSLLTEIQKDSVLAGYQITHFEQDEIGARTACFVDSATNPSDVNVVFRGTASGSIFRSTPGGSEWDDNWFGASVSDTPQQQKAADYINRLPDSYGDKITVSGHSKGGNKAQYVTIVTDRVDRCLSVDGQGFSPEFVAKYQKESDYNANCLKITEMNAGAGYVFGDIVSPLLASIAGTQKYISGINSKGEYGTMWHKPNEFFDNNFSIYPECSQPLLSSFVDQISGALEKLPPEYRFAIIYSVRDGIPAWTEEAKSFVQDAWIGTVNGWNSFWDGVGNFFGDLSSAGKFMPIDPVSMSVGGIVAGAGATTRAGVVSSGSITFDETQVTQCALKLRECNKQLNRTLQSAASVIDTMSNNWDGMAGFTVVSRFRTLQRKFSGIYDDIEAYAKFLDRACAAYTQTETKIQKNAVATTLSIDFFKK